MSISKACHYFQITRQAYYKQLKSEQDRHDKHAQVIELVREKRLRQPRIGTRKLQHLLQTPMRERGIKLGRDRLFALLKAKRLLVPCKRAYHKTTHSHHRFHKHPNLIKAEPGQVIASRPEQVWVADITYIPTKEKFVYLSLVTDAHSRKIVGHHVHASLQTEEVSCAFKAALKSRKSQLPLVHHSDRGIQYCSSYYQQIHQKHNVTCSMTDGYDCYQNALAERINGILKNEFLLSTPGNLEEARQMIRQSIDIYNNERPHLALQYKTPDAVHQASLLHF